jgi:hypothetical protein
MLYALQPVFRDQGVSFSGDAMSLVSLTANKREEFLDDLMDACDEVLLS